MLQVLVLLDKNSYKRTKGSVVCNTRHPFLAEGVKHMKRDNNGPLTVSEADVGTDVQQENALTRKFLHRGAAGTVNTHETRGWGVCQGGVCQSLCMQLT